MYTQQAHPIHTDGKRKIEVLNISMKNQISSRESIIFIRSRIEPQKRHFELRGSYGAHFKGLDPL